MDSKTSDKVLESEGHFWVILSGSYRQPEVIRADTELFDHEPTNQMRSFRRIEDARERKAWIKSKFPHLKVWIVELDYAYEPPNPLATDISWEDGYNQ